MKNKKHKNFIKVIAWILVLFSVYISLVISDYFLRRFLTYSSMEHRSEAKSILESRIQEDVILRKDAINKGYKPMIFPESVESYPILRSKAIEFDAAPLAPQPKSNLYFCNEGYGMVKYMSDRYGFRNDDKNWDDKPDILLIGDSFVHGACVDQQNTISGELQKKFKVINLGTAGNNPLHYAALAKNFVPITKPKIVVLTFFANDNGIGESDSIYFKKYFIKNHRYLVENEDKLSLPDNLNKFYESIEPIVLNITENDSSSFTKSGNIFYKVVKYLHLPTIRHILKMVLLDELHFSSRLAIDEALKVCRLNGCELFVMWIPSSKFWHPNGQSIGYSKQLRKYSEKNNVQFIDTENELNLISNSYAIQGPHLSPKGYEVIANLISNKITPGKGSE